MTLSLLLGLLPTRSVLIVPWIVALAGLHCLLRVFLARRNHRPLPNSTQLAHEAHWFGASVVVLAGVCYEPILQAFFEVPWYLGIAAFAGLIESVRALFPAAEEED